MPLAPGAGSDDIIELPKSLLGLGSGATQADAFNAVMARTANVNGNAVISIDVGDIITLAAVTKVTLDPDDFSFV